MYVLDEKAMLKPFGFSIAFYYQGFQSCMASLPIL